MMRSGHLLAEESPNNLLAVHGLESLEDVFLKLCMKDVQGRKGPMPVVATLSGSGKTYPAIQQAVVQQAAGQQQAVVIQQTGHDNPAFAQDHSGMDITTADIDHGDNDEDADHKNLAQLSIVSFCFHFSFPFFFLHFHVFVKCLYLARFLRIRGVGGGETALIASLLPFSFSFSFDR